MSDQKFDAFELRLGDDLQRYVAGVEDPMTADVIADQAMRPTGLAARVRSSSRGRRLLLLGLAAVLLIPAAAFGAAKLLPQPKPDDGYQAIFLRRDDADESVAVYAVRGDGMERLVATVPDSVLAPPNDPESMRSTIGPWGTVSDDGWLALDEATSPWNVVLVNLRDPGAPAWVVPNSNVGGISAAWGPTNLLAADNGGSLQIIDPVARSVRGVLRTGQLIGGGPAIVWTADGGILEQDTAGGYKTLHLDGTPDTRGFPALFDPRHLFGPGGTTIRLCELTVDCAALSGAQLGSVQLVQPDGTTSTTIYSQQGPDRPMLADFTATDNEYWIVLSHDLGRQLRLLRVNGDGTQEVSEIDKSPTWQSLGMGYNSPDGSLTSMDLYDATAPSALIIPTDSGPATWYAGQLAGFTRALTSGQGRYTAPIQTAAPADGSIGLPTLEELIASETTLNPSHTVVDAQSRDAVAADEAIHDYTFRASESGTFDVYFDCIGSTVASVDTGGTTLQNPCIRFGSYGGVAGITAGDEITVRATGNTSWRVVLYATAPVAPGASAAPVPVPQPQAPDASAGPVPQVP